MNMETNSEGRVLRILISRATYELQKCEIDRFKAQVCIFFFKAVQPLQIVKIFLFHNFTLKNSDVTPK